MRRSGVWIAGMLIGCAAAAAARSEELDAAQVQTLSAAEADRVTYRGDSARFGKLVELSPEAAAALAKRPFPIELTVLENPRPAVIAAFAGHTAGLSLPKLTTLSLDQAQALAGYTGGRLALNGLTALSPEVARALAAFAGQRIIKDKIQPGTLELNGVKEPSPEAAAVIAECKGVISLTGLASLTSIPLAHKLGSQPILTLAVPTLSDDVARALFLGPQAARNTMMSLGLKELSVEAAKALGERGRTLGGHWQFNELEAISDEVAEALSAPAAIRCKKVTALSDRAATALNRYVHAHMYALADVSNESLEMFSRRQGFMIHGLRKLDCVPFAATLMSNNSDFLDLPQLETISEEAADALAADVRRSKRCIVPLPALTALSSVALAEVLAEGPLPDTRAPRGANQEARRKTVALNLARLETAPDAVVRALAKRTGPLSLGLTTLSVEAATAIAVREQATTLGTARLSDEAATALAKAKAKVTLPNLADVSAAGSAALRENPMIELPKAFGQAK